MISSYNTSEEGSATMSRSPVGIVEHVGLVMRDLDAGRRLFHEQLRLPIAEYPDSADGEAFALKAGDTIVRVVSIESSEAGRGRPGLSHVAFKVPSLSQTEEKLKKAGIGIAPDAERGSGDRKSIWSDPATTIGIPLQFVEASADLRFKPSAKPPLIERVDHLGIACRDSRRAQDVYVDGLGWPLESTQTDSEFLIPIEVTSNDKYGATSHTRAPIPAVGAGLIALFVTVGDFDLEIMQPLSAATIRVPLGTIPGSVGQDQGAIAQALDKRGEGLLHIGFKTPDMRNAIKTMSDQGIRMIDPISRPGARNSQIAFMDRRTTEGILLHFVERKAVD
jgi:catechol 2,3-dioxygenase-like lactoylglutathione lyase family enzyme